jgi:hypothetical protein
MMNGGREQAFQRINQFRQPGSAPGQRQGAGSADDDYDHYNVEGSDPQLRGNRGWNQSQRRRDFSFDGDNVVDDLGGAVLGAALGFAGRAIGRRMKKAFEEKVVPAMEAKAAQAQQQFEQSKAEQDAIVARYPELRGCTKDQVVFLDGGVRTVPVSEVKMPVTLAQADSIVARLRLLGESQDQQDSERARALPNPPIPRSVMAASHRRGSTARLGLTARTTADRIGASPPAAVPGRHLTMISSPNQLAAAISAAAA